MVAKVPGRPGLWLSTPANKRLPRIRAGAVSFRIHTLVLSDQHPQPFPPNPPQQQRSRMIHRQLSFPQPFPPNPFPPQPPQQQSRRMIHRHEDIPLPLSHPHPQFVAVKSLILNPPVGLLFTVLYYAGARKV